MIALKVLNNNCVVSKDDGKEVILMGSGLGFGLRKGDTLDIKKIQKVFRLERSILSKFQNVIKEIPSKYIMATDKAITYIKENVDCKINDSIYITLSDHIWISSDRIKRSEKFDNILLVNVKALYHKEYEVALHVTKILKEFLDVDFDEAEADFITLHIINASINGEMTNIHKITRIVSKISDYVVSKLSIDLSVDGIVFDRFLVHCRFLIQKIISGQKTKEQFSSFIHRLILKDSESGTKEKECIDGIVEIVKNECNYTISGDEKLFLYIHIAKLETHRK